MAGPVERLAVLGTGLVGGSLALAARAAGIGRVVVTDADERVREVARAAGFAHEVVDSVAEAAAGAEVVVAAVPAAAVPDVLLEAAAVAPDAVLTDAAGLKAEVVLEVDSRLREAGLAPGRFVGGHPMAGSELSGPEAADARLFQGATWVLTPIGATDDAALGDLSALLRRLGARVLALPPDRHDELVAVVSHLPQVVASALADVAEDVVELTGDAVLAVAGGGFRDTTRIAASDPSLWVPILRGNRAAVLEALELFAGRLERVRAALTADDVPALTGVLARASASRRRLLVRDEDEFVDLVVALDDRPGQLALATTALGGAGVNVEDVAMRHATEAGRGALLLRVAAGDASRSVRVLSEAGLAAHVEHAEAGA